MNELISASLDIAIDNIKQEVEGQTQGATESFIEDSYGYGLGKMFTGKELILAMVQLRDANHSKKWYGLTSFHKLILYSTLEIYIEIHNTFVEEDMQSQSIKDTHVGIIDFGNVISTYYPDIDFLLQAKSFTEKALKIIMDVNEDNFGPVMKAKPHPEEMALKEIPYSEYDMKQTQKGIYTRNRDYPYNPSPDPR